MKYIIIILSSIIIILLFLLWNTNQNTKSVVTEIITDTIIITKQREPIHIQAVGRQLPVPKNKTQVPINQVPINSDTNEHQDSQQVEIGFISMFDTIHKQDTIAIKYEHPQNLFTFDFLPSQDSIVYKEIKIKQEKEKWWVKPVIISSGILVGFIIGKSIK